MLLAVLIHAFPVDAETLPWSMKFWTELTKSASLAHAPFWFPF
jgi:hypothetical protein